ncbi:class I SAM-dependent methyltransferase [Hyphobacterium sp.]|jgi:ubiquinone/menaquinone biosynthesis C-methylase UbiE|uniref:class I SAM-dependent methyltransferase n=1 Tax=Hyphobacterium sp. TaxID=2004662 RepID=UPI003BAB1F17
MTDKAKFWDRIAEKYAAQPVADEDAYQRKLAMTRALFADDFEIAEIGCGTGTTALIHAPHVAHVWAVDVSPEMIRIARAKAADQGIENVRFEVGDIETGSGDPGRFDMVMMHSLLHLLDDPREGIRTAWDLLKPGGYFVSSTVCLKPRIWLYGPMIALMRLFGRAPLVHFLSAPSLRQDIAAAGFDIVEAWEPKAGQSVFIIARKPAG